MLRASVFKQSHQTPLEISFYIFTLDLDQTWRQRLVKYFVLPTLASIHRDKRRVRKKANLRFSSSRYQLILRTS